MPSSSRERSSGRRSRACRSGAPAERSRMLAHGRSSSLHRGEHLHARAVARARTRDQRARGTTSPSTATATPRASGVARRAALAAPSSVSPPRSVGALAVERDHCSAPARAGARGEATRRRAARSAAQLAPARRAAAPASRPRMSSAVSGASRMPLRWWPVAQSSPSSAPAPIAGALSGVPGPKADRQLLDLQLADAGDQLVRVAQQLVDAADGRRRVEAAAPRRSRRARSGRRRAAAGSRRRSAPRA